MTRWAILIVVGTWLWPGMALAQSETKEDPPVHGVREKTKSRRGPTESKKARDSRQDREGRGIRDDRTRRDPVRKPPQIANPGASVKPVLPVPRGEPGTQAGPTYLLGDGVRSSVELRCPEALVCALNPADDYLAWMLVGQTTIPYRGIAESRASGASWRQLAEELSIEPVEFYAALGRDLPDHDDPLRADLLEDSIKEHAAGIRLPRFRCEVPVVIDETRDPRLVQGPSALDEIDEIVADRISDETGWCRDELLEAREMLGSWGRVARKLYISPFLFEASFGLEIPIDQVGGERVARYPRDAAIRDVAERGAWPEVLGR